MSKHKITGLSILLALMCLPLVPGFGAEKMSEKRVQQVKPVPLEIRFLISEPCSLVRFVETISDRDHTTTWMRDWFLEKRGKDAVKDKDIAAKYQTLLDKISSQHESKDRSGRQLSLSQRIAIIAAKCNSLNDLLKKLKNLLSEKDYNEVAGIYIYFAPLYHEMVWEPRKARLEIQLAEFKAGAKESKMNQKAEQVEAFMNTRWVSNMPFDIVLVPLPDAKKHSSHGESLGQTQIVELLVEHDFADQSDVVFHEVCHSLWGRKKDLVELSKAFTKVNGDAAFCQMNEGLATALGQGWFHHVSFPGVDLGRWYDDEMLNKLAHSLFPLVSEYLEKEERIDDAFAKRATEIFSRDFPDSDSTMKYTSVLSLLMAHPQELSAEFHKVLHKALPRLNSMSTIALSHVNLMEAEASPYGIGRQVVLIARRDIPFLKKNKLSAEQIKLLQDQKDAAACLRINGLDTLFCFGDDLKSQEEAFQEVLSKERWLAPINK